MCLSVEHDLPFPKQWLTASSSSGGVGPHEPLPSPRWNIDWPSPLQVFKVAVSPWCNSHLTSRGQHFVTRLPILLFFLFPSLGCFLGLGWGDVDEHPIITYSQHIDYFGSLHYPLPTGKRSFLDHGRKQHRFMGINI